MSIKEEFLNKKFSFSGNFVEQKDKSLFLSSIIAERKAFLSKKTLTYRCRIKINETEKKVFLFEILEEKGAGMTSGGDGGEFTTQGFGFKVEKYNTMNGTRKGTIQEVSALFGKQYTYTFNWEEVKDFVLTTSTKYGYQMEVILDERTLQKR